MFELALKFTGDAYRVVYGIQMGSDLGRSSLQKKSKSGIKTPKSEIDLVIERLKRLKESLK